MAIGAIWRPPIDQQTYDTVREKVFDAGRELGVRFHAAGQAEEGWRIVEVWDSQEGLEKFISDVLRPAIDEVSGGQAPEFRPEVFEIHFEDA
jgi:hypothetical protein